MAQLLHHLRWKSVAELLSRALSFVFIFCTARVLGAAGYGAYSLPLAWGGIWILTLDWGTHHLLIREIGEGRSLRHLLPPALLLKGIASLVFVLGMTATAWLTPELPASMMAAAILWTFALSWNDGIFALLNAHERFQAEALYRNGMRFLLLLVQLPVLFFYRDVDVLLWASALTQMGLSLALTLRLLWPHRRGMEAAFQKRMASHKALYKTLWKPAFLLWKKGLSFWLTSVAWLIYLKLDLVMLPHFLDSKGLQDSRVQDPLAWLGLYQGSVRLYEVAALGGFILSMSLYPLWVKWDETKRQQVWRRLNLYLWPVMLLMTPVAYFMAPRGVPLLLGPEFTEAVELFQILSLSLPFVVFNQTAFSFFAARHQQHLTALITTVCLLVNGILNAVLIPAQGAAGAAYSTLIADAVLTLGFIGVQYVPIRRTPAAH